MNYAYDPELPYVVTDFGGRVISRWHEARMAQWYVENHPSYSGREVIDTTPNLEDARFITWIDEDDVQRYYAEKTGFEWVVNDGGRIGSDGLAEWIGDAEVTVLVPCEAGGGSRTEEDA